MKSLIFTQSYYQGKCDNEADKRGRDHSVEVRGKYVVQTGYDLLEDFVDGFETEEAADSYRLHCNQ